MRVARRLWVAASAPADWEGTLTEFTPDDPHGIIYTVRFAGGLVCRYRAGEIETA